MNYDYPEASYQKRRAIIEEHKNYQMGLLYFVANDPRVPSILERNSPNGTWPKMNLKTMKIGPIKFMFVRPEG